MHARVKWTCVVTATACMAGVARGQDAKPSAKARAKGAAAKAAARPGPGTFVVQRIMAIADTNRDGSLTPEEAGTAASKLVKTAEPKKNAAPSAQQLAQVLNSQLRPQGMGPGGPGGPPPDGFGGPPGGGPGGGPGGPPPDFGGPGGPPGGPGGDQPGGQARRGGGQGGGQDGPGGPPPGGFGGPDGPPPDGPPPGGFGGGPGGPPGGPGGPGGFGGPGTMIAQAAVEYGDANGDGKLSSQEARAAAQKFIKELDKDKKGKVSATALLEVVGRRMGPPGSLGPRASAILAYADANKDGKLTADEASAAATKFVAAIQSGGDGSVGPDALARAMGMPSRPNRGGGRPDANRPAGDDNPGGPGGPPGGGPPGGPGGGPPGGGPAGRIMALADGDNDGKLTPDEAGAAAAKLVQQADPKGDGLDLEALRDSLNKLAGPPPGGPGGPGGPPDAGDR